MFLSNAQAAAMALSLLIVTAAGCSWLRRSEPVALTPAVVAQPETVLPFEAEEPATYQADFVTITAGAETRSHFARKVGKWRIDTFAGDRPIRSIINGEKYVYLDHVTKQYSEPPTIGPDPQPQFINGLTTSMLSEKQPAKFEKLATEGTLERFSVTVENSNGRSTIVFDPAIKMVVGQDFDNGFAFEMRNFTLEVGEDVFAVPTGYRKVAWTTFKQQ